MIESFTLMVNAVSPDTRIMHPLLWDSNVNKSVLLDS